MVREIVVDLDSKRIWSHEYEGNVGYGKALAVQRIIKSKNPNRTIYLTGFTPITASGLGFAGKMNLYGISLLGGNLQGSRSGGLVARYLTRLGVAGIEITGECDEPQVLVIDAEAAPHLVPINSYGKSIHGTTGFARYLYAKHGDKVGLAITDPATTGFDYNAVTCNAKHGQSCHRVAGRSTSRFGRNGLVGVVVERSEGRLFIVDAIKLFSEPCSLNIGIIQFGIEVANFHASDKQFCSPSEIRVVTMRTRER